MVLASRLIFTVLVVVIAVASLQFVWTREVDLSLLVEKIAEFLPTRKHPFKADITYRNVLLVEVTTKDPKNPFNGRLALLVYAMNIVNTSGGNAALKEVRLRYSVSDNSGDLGSVDLEVSPVSDRNGKVMPALLIRTANDNLFVSAWDNLQAQFQLKLSKQDGEVWSGSSCFVFPQGVSDPTAISDLQVVLNDFLGNSTSVPLSVRNLNPSLWKQHGKLWYGKFILDSGEPRWAD